MSELQQEAEQETVEEPQEADLAPDSPPSEGEEKAEKQDSEELIPKSEADQIAQKAINKQHRKYREEQRKREELEKRLKDLEQQSQTLNNVDIPPIPDSWDENYEDKVKARDAAILQKAKIEASQQLQAEREANEQRAREAEELKQSQQRNDKFLENARKLGVSQEALNEAQDIVISYGVGDMPGLAAALVDDPDGPVMVQYLASNLLELNEIVNADPVLAGIKLANVKVKAAALKPKPTAAPDPATSLDGRGAPEKQRGPKGATYE